MSGETVVTFDFYGTLVQWHETLEAAARDILAGRGRAAAGAGSLLRDFAIEGHRLRDASTYRPYREILRASLAFAMDRAGLAPSEADAALLIERLSCIPAHADVPPALAELKKRYRLAAISNTDDDLIAGSLPSLGLELDAVVTAQQARAYKPDLRLFRHAHAVLGVTAREVVHVAASQPLDMAVCRTLGIRAFWVNRRSETAEAQYLPFTEVTDLGQVVRQLQTSSASQERP
jgi:2-haloacid dehalogenase